MPWRILVVDDDAEICDQVREYIHGEDVAGPGEVAAVEVLTDFDRTLARLEAETFDLLILDVRRDADGQEPQEEAGAATLAAVRARRFLPTVFYTALPQQIPDATATPLVRVVTKTDGLPQLLKIVRELFATRLPQINRALVRHMESVQRDYMWEFVASHWDQFGAGADRTSLAYFLSRRIARSLSGPAIHQFVEDLGDPGPAALANGQTHPMLYYVIPPLESLPALAGDLFHGAIADRTGFWFLLTPSCDLARSPADEVLLAKCAELTGESPYLKWQESRSKATQNDVRQLMRNRIDRYHYLPAALDLPHMLVDFQGPVTIPTGGLEQLSRRASLDSPFAEAVLSRFVRFYSRLGTPDLDIEEILAGLEAAPAEAPPIQ